METRRKLKDKISSSRTRAVKREAQKQYNEANQEVRRAIKHDKREFINNLAKETESAAHQHRMRDLYELTRKLAVRKGPTSKPIKVQTRQHAHQAGRPAEKMGRIFQGIAEPTTTTTRLYSHLRSRAHAGCKYQKTQQGRNSKSNPET